MPISGGSPSGPQPGPQGVDGEAVPEQQVVGGRRRGAGLGAPGGVDAAGVAEHRRAPRLVDRGPPAYPVAEGVGDDRGVVGEALRGGADLPAAAVLERLGEIPVVQRGDGLDAVGQQLVDERPVEVEPAAAGGARPDRLDAGPGDREAVGGEPEAGHEGHVVGHAPAVVGGDGAGVAAGVAGGREGVPDRRPPAVEIDAALDLVRRGRRPPQEPGREAPGDRPVRRRRRDRSVAAIVGAG